MPDSELLATLKKLHAEISQTEQLDDETRGALRVLFEDIQDVIGGGQGPSEDTASSLKGRIQESVLNFESEHPRLTALLNQIGDGLANLGI